VAYYEQSGYAIDRAQAENLYSNYHTRISPQIPGTRTNVAGPPIGQDDEYLPTESIWISLYDLKCYIAFLDEVAQRNGKPISGVNIHLGAYGPSKTTVNDNKFRIAARDGDYRSRETVFMGPTYRTDLHPEPDYPEIMRHKTFFIRPHNINIDKYKGDYVPYSSDFTKIPPVKGDTNQKSGTPGTDLLLNELNTMPPMTDQ
jgi:hypothetical protein